jgi:sensor histidine kinase regulating citrate/malate metabolism
MEAKIGYQ